MAWDLVAPDFVRLTEYALSFIPEARRSGLDLFGSNGRGPARLADWEPGLAGPRPTFGEPVRRFGRVECLGPRAGDLGGTCAVSLRTPWAAPSGHVDSPHGHVVNRHHAASALLRTL